MSSNVLRDWRVNPGTDELKSLNYLDVTENGHWLPSDQFLRQLSNLTTVGGVQLSAYCQNCSLVKGQRFTIRWLSEIGYGKSLHFATLGFHTECADTNNDVPCFFSEIYLPLIRKLLAVAKKASFVLYATGSVALLVNGAVSVLIVFKKSLRNDLAVRLLLNVAVCDFLVGLVTVLHARFNRATLLPEFVSRMIRESSLDIDVPLFVYFTGPILTCAVACHVLTSVLLMLDKFFKIVFAMKPDVRLGRKTVVLFLLFSWLLCATFAVLPTRRVAGMTYTGDGFGFTPLPIDEKISTKDDGLDQRIGLAVGSQIALVILEVISFFLYVPIFIVARRSGANVGVINREAAIARKIASLVCTNLIFFSVPVILGAFQAADLLLGSPSNLSRDLTFTSTSLDLNDQQWSQCLRIVFPVLCLSINSILDPFLCALQHPKVKQQLNPLLSRCRNAIGECFVTLGQSLGWHSSTVDTANDEIETQREESIRTAPSEHRRTEQRRVIHDTGL